MKVSFGVLRVVTLSHLYLCEVCAGCSMGKMEAGTWVRSVGHPREGRILTLTKGLSSSCALHM